MELSLLESVHDKYVMGLIVCQYLSLTFVCLPLVISVSLCTCMLTAVPSRKALSLITVRKFLSALTSCGAECLQVVSIPDHSKEIFNIDDTKRVARGQIKTNNPSLAVWDQKSLRRKCSVRTGDIVRTPHVSAKDLGTGKEQKIRIESSSGLSDQDIERMVKEAELHAEEDKRSKESAEARNEADNLVYSVEKNLKDLGDKIGGAEKAAVEAAIAETKKALEGGDAAEIKAKTEALKQASYKIAEEIYKQQPPSGASGAGGAEAGGQSGGGSQGGSGGGGGEKSAEDADFEVVKD